MTSDSELWIHQESAIISADSHDVWRFTPEFLIASEIVSDTWICRKATQLPDEVTIQIGPSHWRMTPEHLWITEYPDQPLDESARDTSDHWVSILTSKFLEAVPYVPSRRLWLFWQVSIVKPDREQWMLETFLNRNWPNELGTVSLQPQLAIRINDLTIQMNIKGGISYRRGEAHQESTVFDCFVSRGLDQTVGEMLQDLPHMAERLFLVERSVRQLLESGS